jgi:D-alanyl-D-alanine carboxypeptidase/D-alanyl-D-alanine endopeptidase (penicillin-binding protein 7)
MYKNALPALFLASSLLFASGAAVAADVPLHSAHVVVMDEATGQVLLQKDADTPAPIASMTKLMTAMVVLDAHLPMGQRIRVDRADYDTIKFTRSGVPAGTVLPRGTMLQIALMSSDNHAAAALARTYPGGRPAFLVAVQRKIAALGLQDTELEEPTGLSPHNHATALDMAKILAAASAYPEIADATTQRSEVVAVNGRRRLFHNTNGFVGSPGWDILASKTGFTNEAGRCLSMRLEEAGHKVLVVLMGAVRTSARSLDALNIRRWLATEGFAAETMTAGAAPDTSITPQGGLHTVSLHE